MSLELAIQQNTEALNVLVSLLKSGNVPAALTPKVAPKDAVVKTVNPTPAAPALKVEAVAVAAETAQAKITYEDIRKPFLDMVNKKGRSVAEALLLDLGLEPGQKLSAIAEADYGKALSAIQKASA